MIALGNICSLEFILVLPLPSGTSSWEISSFTMPFFSVLLKFTHLLANNGTKGVPNAGVLHRRRRHPHLGPTAFNHMVAAAAIIRSNLEIVLTNPIANVKLPRSKREDTPILVVPSPDKSRMSYPRATT